MIDNSTKKLLEADKLKLVYTYKFQAKHIKAKSFEEAIAKYIEASKQVLFDIKVEAVEEE